MLLIYILDLKGANFAILKARTCSGKITQQEVFVECKGTFVKIRVSKRSISVIVIFGRKIVRTPETFLGLQNCPYDFVQNSFELSLV